MKKFLLFAITLFSVQLCFSETLTSKFVFDNMSLMSSYSWSPKALNINHSDSYVSESNPTNTITNGDVSLTLGVRKGYKTHGVTLDFDNEGEYPVGLMGQQNSLFTISVPSGYTLDYIVFYGSGLLNQDTSTTQGDSSPGGALLTWNHKNVTTNTASFWAGGNGTSGAYVTSITVSYNKPSTPLALNSVTPTNGATVESFSSLTYYFNSALKSVLKSDGVTISGPNVSNQKMTIGTPSSYSVKASLPSSITKLDDGEYTISVAAGTFQNTEGSTNGAFNTKINVYAKRDILTKESYTPASGAQLDVIKVVFGQAIKVDDTKSATAKLSGTYAGTLSLSVDPEDATMKTVLLTASAPLTALGSYTIEVPASAVHLDAYGTANEAAYDRWNPAFTLTYTVDRPQSETMIAARALLKTGIGYPAATSEAYLNLKQAIDSEADDETLTPLMEAFQAVTNVTLPTSGSYYKISKGSTYFAYSNGALSTTSSASSAYSFLATKNGDGTYTLTTTEATGKPSKYLASGAISETATNLTLAKGTKFGVLSISGFTGDYTFTAGSKPATPVDPSTSVTPDFFFQNKVITNAGDDLFLVVDNVTKAVLSETAAPYITNSSGQKVTVSGSVLTPASGSYIKFNVNTAGLAAGIYLLNLPKGTFVYTVSQGTVVDKEVSGLQFTITNGGSTPGGGDEPGGDEPGGDEPGGDDPTPEIVTPTISLSASAVNKGTAITVTFGNVDKVEAKSITKATLKDGSGVVSTAQLTKVASSNVKYSLSTSSLTEGSTYTLTIPTGTFTYTKTGATVNDVQLVSSTFSINKSSSGGGGGDTGLTIDNPDDAHKYTGYNIYRPNYHQGDQIADVDLNELYIYVYETTAPYSIAANPDAVIEIDGSVSRGFNAKRYLGHFENCPEFATKFGMDGTKAIKLVMDNPILAGELDYYKGIYSYDIPAGAFGDANYGNYLKKNSLGLSSCKWNAANPTGIHFPVDNVVANTRNLSEEVRAKAVAVVNAVGAGYPSESHSARVALKNLVKNGMGDDAQWEAALQEVYKITEVEAPISRNYYKVEAVASNGDQAWLMYDGSQLLLTKDASKATALKTTGQAGKWSLETGDGKFVATLDLLVPSYDPAICAYDIAKMPQIGSASYEQTYGLVTLHSPQGYMSADVSKLTWAAATSVANVFTTTRTNGFRLTSTILDDIAAPDITVTLTPAPGQVSKLNTVTVNFSGLAGIEVKNPNSITLKSANKTLYPKSVNGVAGSVGEFVMTFEGVEDNMEYDFKIGDGAFTYQFAGTTRYLDEFQAHYYIREQPITAEELQMAQNLLNNKGIGYPQTLSNGRKALQAVVENPAATNVDFDQAIAAFYAETKVTLPSSGKWYKIAAIASDNTASWLQYDGTKVVPVSDVARAAAFQATDNDGAFNFMTIDGKRLRLMKHMEADGSISSNLTTMYDEKLNGLILEKLPVPNTLGMLAISGSLDGKTDAFAQVNVPQNLFTTAADVAPVYTETLTNAFTFLEVSPSDLPVLAVNIEFNMNDSTELESLTQVELTLTTNEVNLKDQNLITLTDEDGKAYTVAGVTKKTGTNNAYVITFGELPLDNTYTLNVANGAFTFAYAGNTYDVDGAKLTCIVLPQRAASQDVENAKNLLKKSGLGYPASKSASRTLLKAFTTSGRPTAKEYASVVEAFYNETDIEKPIAGRYYVLSAIASDGAQAWLAYDGKELSLTNDATKATGLKVTDNKNGTYQLILGNGKFLATLDTTTDSYDKETNPQTIGRFPTKDIDPIRTIGLFSLKNGGGYATVDMKEMKVLPSSESAVYGADVTNAFRFAVTSKESIAAPQPTFTFDPEDGAKLDKIKYINVTFSDHAPVNILNRESAVLTNGTDSIKPLVIDSYDDKPNYFTFTFTDVAPGHYYELVIPEGMFGYDFADSTYVMPEIKVGYSLKEPEATAQQKKEAIQLLAKTGLGCPSADSKARLRLAELVEKGGTLSEFDRAIANFKNDTEVDKPVVGDYYLISAVGWSGRKQYLVCDGDKVNLTLDEEQATPFKIDIHEDGSFTFETNGKFLKQLKSTSLVNGLSSTYDTAENDLFVERLVLEEHSVEETMGYFSIRDANNLYALVDVREGSFMTNSTLGLAYFDEDWTNGFVFTKTDAPIPDAINGITVDAADEPVFDLQGRRVTGALKRGQLYVKGGRKFVAK